MIIIVMSYPGCLVNYMNVFLDIFARYSLNMYICRCMGIQSGAAVRRPHGMHQDVGSNPAAARNEKTHIGQTPAQKVPQLCGRI